MDRELDFGRVTLVGRVVERYQGRVEDAVLAVGLDVLQRLALVGGEGGHVHESEDVTRRQGGVGEDGAAVGVADGQDGPRDLPSTLAT